MDNFIVSALKYRPSTFATVVGQPSITSTLKNAIKNNHLAHAYLFCGPRGVGKTTCARIFAKTINCLNRTDEAEACNECESCNSFNQDRSFNIHELDAASNSSVENIRSLIEQVRIPPQIGKYSLYIIDEVHMLSASAFNAFLKTLEEPPVHAIFILATTEKHKIIPTILSRCQIFDFNRIKAQDAVNHLKFVADKEQINYEDEGLNIIAQKADGSMRDALSIFDQIVSFSNNEVSYSNVIESLSVLDYEFYFKLVDGFLENDTANTFTLFDEILSNGFDGHNFINGVAMHFRDLLVCKNERTMQLLEVGNKLKEKYNQQSSKCSPEFLFDALKICNKADVNYKSSKNYRLHIEIALLELCNLNIEKKNFNSVVVSNNKEDDKSTQVIQKDKPTEKKEDYKPEVPNVSNKDLKEDQETTSIEKDVKEVDEVKQIEKIDVQKPSISIKDAFSIVNSKSKIVTESIKEESTEELIHTESRNESFNEDKMLEVWNNYNSTLKDEKRLFSVLSANTPVLKDDFLIEYSLKNVTQEKEIQVIYPKLSKYLKDELKNDKIVVKFSIEEIEKDIDLKKRLYTDQDKYKYLNEKNPNLDKLRQQMNLDFQ